MAVTSYPGTVTPLRRLSAFTEAERDVFWGRAEEIEELASLVTGDGYRAGLLHGEAGVGKTSLLCAGLIPYLRDSGIIALLCRDNTEPASALARELTEVTGTGARDNESPVAFLTRAVAEAMRGQQFIFILDDVDSALASRDDTVIRELADLFARVVTRSGGRARFLFCCESSEIHSFGILERRTGSLFPPSSRLRLEPFSADEAAVVFDRMASISGLTNDTQLTTYIAKGINHGGPVSAAELQVAALAVRDLSADTAPAVDAIGGPSELSDAWLIHSAKATGDENAALRLLSQVSQGKGKASLAADWIATRANVEVGFATSALNSLSDCGVLAIEVGNEGEARYRLAHQVLAPQLRTLSAPAQASAQRAFEPLGGRAQSNGRLSLREWIDVRKQRIEPNNAEQRAVLERTKRFATTALAIAVAVPLLLLIAIYISMSGRAYFDIATVDGSERLVVRDGRPGLSMFHWLGFGDIVADTGFDRQMIADDKWSAVADNDITFGADAIGERSLESLEQRRAALVRYATVGDAEALDVLAQGDPQNDELGETLDSLAMIGRGGDGEQELVKRALAEGTPSVRISAIRFAAAVERRRPGSYRAQLAAELASNKSEHRRLAASVVDGMPDKMRRTLWSAALERATSAEAKAELGAQAVTASSGGANPNRLTSLISNPETDDNNRRAARASLLRLVSSRPIVAVPAIGDLAANSETPERDRVWALGALFEHAVVESEGDLKSKLSELGGSESQAIKAAALPLLARLNPSATAADLAAMLENKATPTPLRAASALAWGEIAASDRAASESALNKLLEDRKAEVKAAAARALGKLGRSSQGALVELTKDNNLSVATGAAFGLVESVAAGGKANVAVRGIGTLWKKKGRAKRRAAEAFAALARHSPNSVTSYLAAAARDDDDSRLHAVGVRGLCNALAANGRKATTKLLGVASSAESTELRRTIAECAADHKDAHPADAIRLAEKLLSDRDSTVRLEAVRILATLAADDDAKEAVAAQLGQALGDPSRSVRIIAADAIADLGSAAPTDVAAKLPAIFSRAEEIEKLALLRAAAAVGASELVPLALADSSDRVRVEGLRLALTRRESAEAALQSALTDPSRDVRRQALEALAASGTSLRGEVVLGALGLATRDVSREIADRAIALLASTGDPETVSTRLAHMLASRSDADRRAAATAVRGLAGQDPTRAAQLLEPSLRDPARDVRAAAAISLGFALAARQSIEELAGALRGAEKAPARRLALAAAFAIKAVDDREGTLAALEELGESGPQLSRIMAQLVHGLISGDADALGFLSYQAP